MGDGGGGQAQTVRTSIICDYSPFQSHYTQELTTENVEHLPRSITNEYSAKERSAKNLHDYFNLALCIFL